TSSPNSRTRAAIRSASNATRLTARPSSLGSAVITFAAIQRHRSAGRFGDRGTAAHSWDPFDPLIHQDDRPCTPTHCVHSRVAKQSLQSTLDACPVWHHPIAGSPSPHRDARARRKQRRPEILGLRTRLPRYTTKPPTANRQCRGHRARSLNRTTVRAAHHQSFTEAHRLEPTRELNTRSGSTGNTKRGQPLRSTAVEREPNARGESRPEYAKFVRITGRERRPSNHESARKLRRAVLCSNARNDVRVDPSVDVLPQRPCTIRHRQQRFRQSRSRALERGQQLEPRAVSRVRQRRVGRIVDPRQLALRGVRLQLHAREREQRPYDARTGVQRRKPARTR